MKPSNPLASLVPPTEADADEVDYYRQRLHDPSLLEQAVGVELEGYVFLAVPVGGRRQGGDLSVPEVLTGVAVRRLLIGRCGFPDVRLSWSPYEDACHSVRWGAPPPAEDTCVADGWHYGYSDRAIASVVETYGHFADPRSALLGTADRGRVADCSLFTGLPSRATIG
ncbi:DUF6302 family protein [Streptomyces griseus]|uniref:DUF6302 family protein n=1 Tax=Streptomyces griseus TaxID=1911 RepID=UPI00365836AF